jgi:hypothetical protein
MNRKRVGTTLMVISCLGIILTTVGSFVASGLELGALANMEINTAVLSFIMLFFITIAVFGQDFSKDEQIQPEAELDSSLY